MEFITNILITYGVAYLIADSILLEKPRTFFSKQWRLLGDLLHCKICLSFWIGLALTEHTLSAFAIMGAVAIISKYEE